jgi:16S rRNA (adenine1518-N6/adenine1519-N6)-dimethyltransferase
MSSNFKEIIEKYGIVPKKSLGQNFLIDKNILDKIIKSIDLSKEDRVLEIGPGLGMITERLNRTNKVVAVETDSLFVEILSDLKLKNTRIVEDDILEYIKKNKIAEYKVVANLPYYLTSFLIRNLLEREDQPKEIYLIIQKEVAERICTQNKKNLLAISVNYYALTKKLFNISKNSFWPVPKVDSALIRIIPNREYSKDDKNFFKIIKAGFSSPRKKLANNLSSGLNIPKDDIRKILEKNGLNVEARPESLSIDEWIIIQNELGEIL